MIRLYSNKAEYTADIADELRLFLAKEEITISGSEACADIAVTIQNGKDDGLKDRICQYKHTKGKSGVRLAMRYSRRCRYA